LKAPVTKRLKLEYDELLSGKLEYDELLSSFAFKLNLRRYSKVYKLFAHASEHHISWTLYWITVMVGWCRLTLSNPR